jgi:hypothetical protein
MLDALETRLEQASTIKRVEGAVDLAAVMEAGKAPNITPTAYVVPLRETPGKSDRSMGPPVQTVTERIAIITVIKKAGDRRGKKANAELKLVRDEIRQLLFGYVPSSEYQRLALGPSGLLSFNNGVIWWQDEFITSQLRDANNG